MRSNSPGLVATDTVTAELAALLDRLTALATAPVAGPDPARIDRITLLERIKAATAQHTEMVAFARSQVDAQLARGHVKAAVAGRGIGDQIGLVCHVSPITGSRRLEAARALWTELPTCRGLLATGRISEHLAQVAVGETRHLDPETRRLVDKQLAEQGIDALTPRRAAALAQRLAYRADPAGYVARGRTARGDRRVSVRPAPDTMARVSGYLPVEQGVACWAALRRHADQLLAGGDPRSRA